MTPPARGRGDVVANGWVRTNMDGPNATRGPEAAADAVADRIADTARR